MFWMRFRSIARSPIVPANSNQKDYYSDLILKNSEIEVIGEINNIGVFFIRTKSGLLFYVTGDIRKFILEHNQYDALNLITRNVIVDFTDLI